MHPNSYQIIVGWIKDRGRVARPWVTLSFAIALFMFISVWLIALYLQQNGFVDDNANYRPLFSTKGEWSSFWDVFVANIMVLAIHFFACVATYIVNRRLNSYLEKRVTTKEVVAHMDEGEDIDFTSKDQQVSRQVGRISLAMIIALVVFSIVRQIVLLSTHIAAASESLDISVTTLMARAALHAFLELTAIFLPLAADLILSAKGRWRELLAGAWFSLMISVPTLLITAAIETWVTGGLFQAGSLFG